jgi:phosphoglycolate phosphatase
VPWGVVTNKSMRFTPAVLQGLALAERAAVVIGGDSTPHIKPHPEPLLEACRRLSVAPAASIYVGDDLRDVQAARAAGMPSVATAWGYLGTGDPPEAWGADHLIDHPLDLLPLLFD